MREAFEKSDSEEGSGRTRDRTEVERLKQREGERRGGRWK